MDDPMTKQHNITVIRPRKIFSLFDIQEIWEYRELLYFFIWRNLKVRYKQTAIGIIWAVFQPTILMLIFTFFFSPIVGRAQESLPYPVFAYIGIIYWQFFSTSLTDVSETLIVNRDIITKVYFPRFILPLADITTRLIDSFVALLLLAPLALYFSLTLTLKGIFFLIVAYVLVGISALGCGSALAALNARYRDVRYVLPFFIQLTLFMSPVIYPSKFAGSYRWLLSLNPLSGTINAVRASLSPGEMIPWQELWIAAIIAFLLIALGFAYFRFAQESVADVI
jgi:lipopolysaccharide transport system permease protein